MRYHAFVTDYDGTLADHDRVPDVAVVGLRELKATGRKLILVTGRELTELKSIFPHLDLFHKVVAENGALIFDPLTLEQELLGSPPPKAFLNFLNKEKVPYSKGAVIVSAWQPHEREILDAIRECGLEHQVIFNKSAVMVLPPAINKATGLLKALYALNISEHSAVAVGDAENDNAMLSVVECSIAVENALPHVKEAADWTTTHPTSEGVLELTGDLIRDDLAQLDRQLFRHFLQMGTEIDGTPFKVSPYGTNILVSGTSGCGKTTLAAAFLENLVEKQYQFCLIDPEGDYINLDGALTIGDNRQSPSIDEIIQVLTLPNENAVVCMLAVAFKDRPQFFKQLLAELTVLRHNTGHPHFIVMDECHHLMPCQNPEPYYGIPDDFNNFMIITTRPELICHNFLRRINLGLMMGDNPRELMSSFAHLAGKNISFPNNLVYQKGNAMAWQEERKTPFFINGCMPRQILMRHKRKYATGDMGLNSFIFRGPNSKLRLRANNLATFIQMGQGVDDETWMFHLRKHDYSTWLRNSVKDEELSSEARMIEENGYSAYTTRMELFKAILDRYTLPG